MLNPKLDLGSYRKAFSKDGRVRIRDALRPEFADALAVEMENLPYKMFCATGTGVAVIDPAELVRWDRQAQTDLQRRLNEAASRAEGFAYFGYRMTEAWRDGAPDTSLGRLHNGLRSKETMETIRTITGANTFDNVFAQATEYRPGHYLTRHLDDPKGEHRKFAFVLGLTRKWDPDWGGLLQFFDDSGQPTDALSPGFNTLDLFDVRHVHSVTFTTPFCQNPRHAVSGWFVRGDPLRPQDYAHPGKQ
jgi:Rps23 Pro-64 3,4-dihydroxylase Tpa1-like proline 4-hydroxylase